MLCKSFCHGQFEVSWFLNEDPEQSEATVYFYDVLRGKEWAVHFVEMFELEKSSNADSLVYLRDRNDECFYVEPGTVHLSNTLSGPFASTAAIEDAAKWLIEQGLENEVRLPRTHPQVKWSNLTLRPIDELTRRQAFIQKLKSLYSNGDVLWGAWDARPDEFEKCFACHRLYEQPAFYLTDLLKNPAISHLNRLANIKAEDCFSLSWISHDAFSFRAKLASLLYSGGAYLSLSPDHEKAWKLANEFVDDLLGPGHRGLFAYSVHQAWADWFKDVAWDVSLICLSTANHRILILHGTDSD